jgi:4-carboxymuconolactone decarboxylase
VPRLEPITSRSALAPEHQDVADAVLEVFGHIRGPFSMLLHSPQLASKLLPLVTFVRQGNIVSETNVRFAAILTAARENEAEYVWAAQVEQARKNGVSQETIERVRTRAALERFAPDERDAVSYVRQLVRNKRADAATFDALRARHGPQWIVELTAIASFFGFVATICNAFEVAAPAGGDKLNA